MGKIIIKELAGGAAGPIKSGIALQVLSSSEVLTAVRTEDGDLKLIGWHTSKGEKITRAASAEAGEVSEIAMTMVVRRQNPPQSPIRRAVTAVRDGSGRLKLISWDIAPNLESITRLKDSGTDAGAATNITIVSGVTSAVTLAPVVLTAVRAANGDLKLITWRLHADGSFERLADSEEKMHQAGEVSRIATCLIRTNQLLTAVRAGNGDLKLILWQVNDDGEAIIRTADSEQDVHQAGAVGEIAMVRTPFGVLTAVQTSSGNLKVIPWQISPPSIISRVPDDDEGGTASALAITEVSVKRPITPIYVASMRSGSGHLKLIAFDASISGIGRTGELSTQLRAEQTTIASFGGIAGFGDGRVVTASHHGFLEVNTWDVSEEQVPDPFPFETAESKV